MDEQAFRVDPPIYKHQVPCLTKRELFAAMAMQGILASSAAPFTLAPSDVGDDAVAHADALINELEKKN